ncbi:GNAT family N-acetyltransferase [Nitratireductor luteus]|uniref:GNAT family N-acetyltransferase n=1 Tax=Nitratireductor luteus TaxID=2976980 RepID=UPI00223FB15C|nr:GNAT family N-acetyltransferase [Nitratireductor luteus]
MHDPFEINSGISLDNDASMMAVAARAFADGQAEGAFPADRDGPTGTECYCSAVSVDGQILGFATWYPLNHGRAWLDLLYVETFARRRGIARALVEHVFDDARAAGCDNVQCGVLDSASHSLSLMNAMGAMSIAQIFQFRLEQAASTSL